MRTRTSRAGTRLGAVIALVAALLGVGAPARAADTASVSIVSSPTPVAVAQHLTIDKLVVRNNTGAAVTGVDVRFDLVLVSNFDDWPFSLSEYETDAACHLSGQGTPSYTALCHYGVQIAAGASAGIAVKLELAPTTASATAPSPRLKITVGTGSDTDTLTVGPIDRVKRTADLAVRVAGQLTGRVGDVVNVQWIVTNNGPYGAGVGLILDAPAGTEWTGSVAAECNPPTIPYTQYECVSGDTLTSGHTLSETWQLKIESTPVGTGRIEVRNGLIASTPDPYLDITDTKTANNVVTFTIGAPGSTGNAPTAPAPAGATATGPTAGATSGSPDPAGTAATPGATTSGDVSTLTVEGAGGTPPAAAALAPASSHGLLFGGIGALVLIAGALSGFVLYRNRSRTAPAGPDDESPPVPGA